MRIVLSYIFISLFIGLFCIADSVNAQTFYGTTDVNIFRDGRDKEFRNKDESPLKEVDFEKFSGLNYYEDSDEFRVKAKYTKSTGEQYFLMPTSSGHFVKYIKVGVLTFQIDKKQYSLNAYQSERIENDEEWNKKYGHAFFIPYKDLTNGKETYGGGRYIYMKIPVATEAILDFNLTFNASCAYGSDKYSCPIPPRANHLKVEIKAGEKSYDYSRSEK